MNMILDLVIIFDENLCRWLEISSFHVLGCHKEALWTEVLKNKRMNLASASSSEGERTFLFSFKLQ